MAHTFAILKARTQHNLKKPAKTAVPVVQAIQDRLEADSCSKFMKALGTGERLKIVQVLLDGPRSVGNIATLVKDPIANVSHHLHILESAGLVESKRDGKFIYYSLNPKVYKKVGTDSQDTLDFGCCRIELGRQK